MGHGDRDASAHLVQSYNKEKNLSIVTDPEMMQIIELILRSLNSCYHCIPYIQEARGKNEHVKQRHRRQKKTQIKFLGMKTAMYDMKNILNVTNSRLDIVEENISELEEIAIETIHN